MSPLHRPCRFVAGPFTRGLLCATTLAMAIAAAQNPQPAPAENQEQDPDKEDPAGFLSGNEIFPDNSILKGVILPAFDQDSQLTNTLTAEELTIVTRKKIEAKNLKIDFFGPNRTPRGTMSLKKSFFDAVSKLLTTKEPVAYVSDELKVDGSSLAFDTENNRGFLYGPVTAISTPKPKETAKADSDKKATAAAGANAPAAEAPAPAPAAEPAPEAVAETAAPDPSEKKDPLEGLTTEEKMAELKLSKDELQAVKALAASRAPQVEEARAKGEQILVENKEKAEDARINMNSFFQAAALTMLLAEAAPEPNGPVPRPVVEAPKEGTEKTTITSDGGAFIDNSEGLIVFLKNVKVVNPEFTLTAQKEVKAFMVKDANSDKSEAEQREEYMKKAAAIVAERARKAEAEKNGTAPPDANATPKETEPALPTAPQDASKPAKPDKPEPTAKQLEEMIEAKKKKKAEGPAAASDIRLLIASGTVLIDYKPKPPENKDEEPKEPVKAAAHLVVYNFEDEEILLQGGSPWVMIGNKLAAVDGEDSFIRVTLKNGRPIYAVTEGGSLKAELELDSMKDKEKDKTKPKEGEKPKQGEGGGKPQNAPKPPNNGAKPNNR